MDKNYFDIYQKTFCFVPQKSVSHVVLGIFVVLVLESQNIHCWVNCHFKYSISMKSENRIVVFA